MSQHAIEAEDLVKKFARRTAPNGNHEDSMSSGAEDIPKPAAKRTWRPFRKSTGASWFTAVDGVNLQIKQGEVFGLLGPNGAGKSTTIRMLCTLLEPTSGTARVNGFDVVKQSNQVRQNLGTVLAGERSIYWKLTARENLEYCASTSYWNGWSSRHERMTSSKNTRPA
jgi:ABC-2 type transport system ATP-binding protein